MAGQMQALRTTYALRKVCRQALASGTGCLVGEVYRAHGLLVILVLAFQGNACAKMHNKAML